MNRNKSRFEKAISALDTEASKDRSNRRNLVPLIIEATIAGATTGEISDTLRSAYGEYRPRNIM